MYVHIISEKYIPSKTKLLFQRSQSTIYQETFWKADILPGSLKHEFAQNHLS